LLKLIHKVKDSKNSIPAISRPIIFNTFFFSAGTNKSKKEPAKGKKNKRLKIEFKSRKK
jgi:hypothetical protein